MKLGSIILGVIVVVFFLSVIFALPFKWLWNWFMPDIFGLVEITLWQAGGLLFLSSMIFKSGASSSGNKD